MIPSPRDWTPLGVTTISLPPEHAGPSASVDAHTAAGTPGPATRLTSDPAILAARIALPRLTQALADRLALSGDDENAIEAALVTAVLEGARFAGIELFAQLVATGVDGHLDGVRVIQDDR